MFCFIQIIYIIFLTYTSYCYANRQVTVALNPGCPSQCSSNVNLVYIQAVGSDDTIHYLWNSNGLFTMFMAKTMTDSNLTIGWDCSSENFIDSIKFNPAANQTAAVIFTKLYEYDDVNDVVDIQKIDYSKIKVHNTATFNWKNVSVSPSDDVMSNKFDILSEDFGNNSLELILTAFGSDGQPDQLPSLKHTANCFQLEVVIDNFKINSSNTRFAVEFVLLDSEQVDNNLFTLDSKKTIDDEYTPGVFLTYDLKSEKYSGNNGLYLQWKPVIYTSEERTTEYSSDSIQNLNNTFKISYIEDYNNSLAYVYYGEKITGLLSGGLNISFGLKGDKYFSKTNYLSWTIVIGSGSLPEEKFSSLVIIVIIVGFGLPALVIILGGVYIGVRRCRKPKKLSQSVSNLIEEEEEE